MRLFVDRRIRLSLLMCFFGLMILLNKVRLVRLKFRVRFVLWLRIMNAMMGILMLRMRKFVVRICRVVLNRFMVNMLLYVVRFVFLNWLSWLLMVWRWLRRVIGYRFVRAVKLLLNRLLIVLNNRIVRWKLSRRVVELKIRVFVLIRLEVRRRARMVVIRFDLNLNLIRFVVFLKMRKLIEYELNKCLYLLVRCRLVMNRFGMNVVLMLRILNVNIINEMVNVRKFLLLLLMYGLVYVVILNDRNVILIGNVFSVFVLFSRRMKFVLRLVVLLDLFLLNRCMRLNPRMRMNMRKIGALLRMLFMCLLFRLLLLISVMNRVLLLKLVLLICVLRFDVFGSLRILYVIMMILVCM